MSYRDRERPRDRDEPSSRYSGRDWGGRDDYRGRERVMTSTVQAPGRTELPPEMINKRKQREEKHARAKKQKIQEEEFVPQDEEQVRDDASGACVAACLRVQCLLGPVQVPCSVFPCDEPRASP